jgi:excinuclease UvrABC nuclease subunit
VKLFMEYILEEIEKIGMQQGYKVSLSQKKDEQNYIRGVMQFFDGGFDIYYALIFSFPENHPKLQYTLWVLNQTGNRAVIEKDGSGEKMMETVKETALKEIHVNLMEGGEIRHLLKELKQTIGTCPQ